MSKPAPAIAFFDLDRTLISINSATSWIRREVRLGHLSRWQALRGGGWILLYHFGFVRMDKALRDAVLMLQGASVDAVTQRTQDFWLEEVKDTIRPGAREAISAHLAQGDRIALLTSSTSILCESVMTELPFEDALCNRLQSSEGIFTGTLEEPICFGEGKVHHARMLAEKVGVDLAHCTFYTDSYSDRPVLEIVGNPRIVHPDPRLARLASRRGWPVIDWS